MFIFRTVLVGLLLLISLSGFAKGSIKVSVALSPAGSFEIQSTKVKGKAIQKGSNFITKGISVKAKSLVTGLELRDNHLHDKLEVKKFKKIQILKGYTKGGVGYATIQVKNINKDITFNYQKSGDNLLVRFNLSLKDFNFSGINYAGVGVKDTVKVEALIPVK